MLSLGILACVDIKIFIFLKKLTSYNEKFYFA